MNQSKPFISLSSYTRLPHGVLFFPMKDPLLDWIQHNIVSENGSYHFLLPIFEGTGGGITKFEKFAWFYKVSGRGVEWMGAEKGGRNTRRVERAVRLEGKGTMKGWRQN